MHSRETDTISEFSAENFRTYSKYDWQKPITSERKKDLKFSGLRFELYRPVGRLVRCFQFPWNYLS